MLFRRRAVVEHAGDGRRRRNEFQQADVPREPERYIDHGRLQIEPIQVEPIRVEPLRVELPRVSRNLRYPARSWTNRLVRWIGGARYR